MTTFYWLVNLKVHPRGWIQEKVLLNKQNIQLSITFTDMMKSYFILKL